MKKKKKNISILGFIIKSLIFPNIFSSLGIAYCVRMATLMPSVYF